MTLRKKTLSFVFSTILVMGIIIYSVTHFVLTAGYIKLETDDIIKITYQASNQLEEDVSSLKSVVGDWAPWDDTYQFIQDLNSAYIENNLMDLTMINLNLNFIIFIDTKGIIRYCKTFDLENAVEKKCVEPFQLLIEQNSILLRNETLKETVSGYALLSEKLVMVASAPILTSKFEGLSRGTLMVGRYLDRFAVKIFEEKLKTPMEIIKIASDRSIKEFLKKEIHTSNKNKFVIQRPDKSNIISSILIEDLSKTPLFILEIKKQRTIFAQGKKSLNSLLMALVIISLVCIAATLIFLERNVLSRLFQLSEDVKKMTNHGNMKDRISLSGNDEISSLSLDINQMLDKLWENKKKLRESESRHSKMVANIGDVIVIIDRDGINKFKSMNIEKLFGWKPEDVVGFSTWENIHPNDLEATQKFVGKLMSEPDSVGTTECRYRCKDGSYSWIEFTGTNLLHDPDINGLLGNYHDITKRKQAENQLQQNVSLLNATQKLAKIGGFEVDLEKQISFWTDEVYRIHDLQPDKFESIDEAIKLSVEYYDPEDREMIIEAFRKCTEEGQAYDLEFQLTTAKGRRIWIRTETNPIMEDGKVIKVVGSFMDITERKRLEEQLLQINKMESIGTLAGGIAHDFNNILFPILGYSEMLLEDIPNDSPFQKNLTAIYSGAIRARDLIKQILAFSRQESRDLSLLKMQPIIKEALNLIRSTIPTTITINQEINPDCGVIKADPIQIHQIVMNMATNAYHAMKDSGGELKVSLDEVNIGENDIINPDMIPGYYACLTVGDTGIGMTNSVKEKIFDPFFTTKEKGKGTGMGLSVVHGIVNSLGGAIHVYSEPGKGTEFNVYIPVEKNSSGEQERLAKKSIQRGTEQILLVDDEEGIITMEKQMLERLGYKVTSRISSVDALEAFRVNPDKFDLIITDMAMPNLSGDKLAVELIKIRPDMPILLCTGFSENLSQERARSLGIKDFLMKPIVMKDLAEKIREVLDEN